ncbi:MAG: hypothetical protein JNM39_05025 [Bdellovibrionaceae bacterium]|nr:hypothetical protein [Pseudobdellovibrionaceae bacterium]
MDWPKDVIFSTIISPAAATYGNRVVVIREKKVRSLDMNYWNHVHSDRWYTYTRDAGEFISYGYIPGSDLVGYQVRTGSKTPNYRISYAIYRAFDPKSKALLVLSGLRRDGSLSTCISQNPEDGFYYHCEYKEGTIITSIPGLSRERVRISGVLVLCGSDNNSENCSRLSDREEGFYRELQVELPGNVVTDLQNRIKNLDVQGKLVRFLGSKDFLHKN